MRGVVLGLLGIALAPLGCSAADEAASATTAPPTCVALYGDPARTELTPYPSNRYLVADPGSPTGKRVKLDATTTADPLVAQQPEAAAELSTQPGFSTVGGVFLKLSAPIDPRGLARLPDADPPIDDPILDATTFTKAGAPMHLVDVTDGAPEKGRAIGIVPRWWEQAKDEDFAEDEFTLLAQPAEPLAPRHDYVFVATRALHARDGSPVGRSEEMDAVLRGGTSDGYDAELLEGLAVVEAALGIDRADVVLATRFTTNDPQAELAATAAARRARPAPAQGAAWTIETPRSANDPRVRFRATFAAPELRGGDGKWRLDANGAAVPQKDVQLEVFLAFSDATQSGPRPVVIFQHGLGGDKDMSWGTSERLASIHARGAAILAIDSPEHGSRTTGGEDVVSSVYGYFGIDQATGHFDIERARDNFRQMASDQLELVRFASTLGSLDVLPFGLDGQPAPDGVPDLDVSQLGYIGHSFGSVQGATILALAPEVRAAVWNVGGAGLMTLLRDSGTFGLVVKGLAPPHTPDGALARFLAVSQAIVDPGDPLNYARYGTMEALRGVDGWAPRDVLVQEVEKDTIVPNSSTDALARAAGLAQLGVVHPISGANAVDGPAKANLPTGSTGVVSQFATELADDGSTKPAVHGDLLFQHAAIAQYAAFLRSAYADGRATAPAPLPPK